MAIQFLQQLSRLGLTSFAHSHGQRIFLVTVARRMQSYDGLALGPVPTSGARGNVASPLTSRVCVGGCGAPFKNQDAIATRKGNGS